MGAKPRAFHFRPEIEPLEDRRLPALTIVPTFDISITKDPNAATIESTINSAIASYARTFADTVTVKITFQKITTGLGSSSPAKPITTTYSAYRAALVTHAKSTDDTTALASLPTAANNPVNNSANITLWAPLARALGLSTTTPASDGTISLNTAIMNLSRSGTQDPAKVDLMAVAEHEIDEILAGGSGLDGKINGNPTTGLTIEPLDLFRFSALNTRSFDTNAVTTAYFSIDGGTTNLVGFNQYSPAANNVADFGDWFSGSAGQGAAVPRVQDAFATPGVQPNLDVELRRLDVLGFTRGSLSVSIDATKNLVVQDTSTGGTNDALNIQADTANSRYVISSPAVSATFVLAGVVPGATISADGYTAFVPFAAVTGPQLNIKTMAGNDSLTVVGSLPAGKSIAFDGGAGANTLLGTNSATTWNITGANVGTIPNVTFQNVQSLIGGTGRDVFHFAAGGSLGGTVDGGAGSNWLDYSAVASGVVANLSTGAASRTTGAFNISNVIGSAAGGDHLTGSAAGSVLVGHGAGNTITAGTGRSVLIGGTGTNGLTGGASDDLIINGKTSYDANINALESILATWQTPQTLAQRMTALQAAGPTQLKVGVTVFLHPDRTVNGVGPRMGRGNFVYASNLRGNAGSNWFFTMSLVSVLDRKAGDVITSS